ncbi:MAG: formylglycine-generating enzyme family protein, partial [Verrucomicrobia bacterium]|nr:formylglycine-generating enzyme family protein [Verrucomicrobiota bacterium]
TPVKFTQADDHPVCVVSWTDIQEFCKWASKQTGQTVRLPTEAQWEYACRAGTTTRFNTTDLDADLPEAAWLWFGTRNSEKRTHPGGRLKPNAWGLYDMHGNLWEMVQDGYKEGYYAESPPTDPQGPPSGTGRISRGGGWGDGPSACRSASRKSIGLTEASIGNGFRVVTDVLPAATLVAERASVQTGASDRTLARSATDDPVWQDAINLLPLIDPQKDAITGEWTVENGGLVGDKEKFAHIEIPYQPPEEYDYRVEFTPVGRKLGGCQVLAKGGKAFQWSLFSHTGGDLFGFSMVGNRFLGDADSPARVSLSPPEVGRRYVSLVEVRNDGLRGYLDGKLLVTWKTDYQNMSLARFWQLRTPNVLGLGCQSRMVFHRIEVREVTGKGTFTRGAPSSPAAAAAWIPLDISVACNRNTIRTEHEKSVTQGFGVTGRGWATTGWRQAKGFDKTALPDDGRIAIPNASPAGFFQLHVADGNDSILLSVRGQSGYAGRVPTNVTLHVVASQQRKFSQLAFLHASNPGDAEVSVTIRYDSGADGTGILHPRDWVPDPSQRKEPLVGNEAVAVRTVDSPPNPDVVEMLAETLPVDLQRALQSLTFTFRSVSPKSDPLAAEKCVAGIFAISALPAVPVTPHSSLITPAVPQPSTLNPQLSAFCAEVAALPAQQQVARVVAKLKEVNPGYDGQAKHKIEDGQVTELSLPGVTLTNIWPVRALAKLQEFDCCASTENRSKLADISPLAGLPLRHLALNATQVSDLSPVRTMPLVSLLCAATPVSDLSPLRGVSLMELDIAHTRVHDLSPLKGMTLESLSCNATETSDLSPLQGMPLRSLRAHYTRVQDLSPLQGTPLKELRFDQGLMRSPRNRDIVRGLTTLETINNQPAAEFWKKVEAGKMPDAAPAPTSVPVTRPPSLVTPAIPQPSTLDPQLSAFCAEVAALPAEQQVARVVAKLKELNPAWDGKEKHGIEGDAVVLFSLSPVNVTDISPVRALTRLRKLYCAAGSAAGGRSALADLRPLTGLLLTNICFNGTQVSNLSPLRGMPLAYLSCQAAPVNDLSPLQGMPLAHMDVGNTRVSDLSPLRGMTLESLSCNGTEIRDLSLLQGMPLQLLQVHHTRVQDLSPLQGTPLKELRFDQGLMSSQRNRDIVRGLTTLETINNQPAAEFWKKVDAGKMPDAAPAPTSVPVTRPPSLVTPAIPQPSTISPQPSDLSAFCAEVAALPPQEQVARVAAKLKELNPGFDGKETHKIEADKVTELAFSSVAVTNIVPVKALTGLKKLTLVPWSKGAKSALSNLSPLQGL